MKTMALGGNLTSAAGVLSLLAEPEIEVKVFALQRLNELVDGFWAEIAEHVSKFEELYEDTDFPEKELSALVASKVYYHLGSFKDSLIFALGAGQRFDVNGTTEYIETILSKCIDHYTQLRVSHFDGSLPEGEDIDIRLESIVNRMFERCLNDRRYKQAVGIAFETRRIDVLQRAIHESGDIPGMLSYCLKVSLSLISSPRFRNTVLQVLVRTYKELATPDYISVCQCYIFLDDAHCVAQVLQRLACKEEVVENVVVAFQIAFDLYENASQQFLRRVMEAIASILPSPPPSPDVHATPVQESGGAAKGEGSKGKVEVGEGDKGKVEVGEGDKGKVEVGEGDKGKVEEEGDEEEGDKEKVEEEGDKGKNQEDGEGAEGVKMEEGGDGVGGSGETKKTEVSEKDQTKPKESEEAMEVEVIMADPTPSDHQTSHEPSHDQSYASSEPEPEKEWERRLRFVQTILAGKVTVGLHQEFLIRNNHTDLQILKNTKDSSRGSVCHNATIIANGLMHFGTTSDTLLRENLEWLKKASNWAKFTATASLGLVHWGHEKEALNLMASYLPKDSANSSPYAEGGGLYAIGLIHANHGLKVMDYLANELKTNNSEIVRHGGCLGLGLAAMGTANLDIYDLLKENLMTRDDAVIGEAAGLAMGLVMIGTKSSGALEDMINYARDTQHEKIQRGLAVGIAMLMYGQLEEADTLIEELCRDKDPLLRRSGMYTVAMAYCGSGDNRAIRRLLHVAVSDVDNDVRRAAVTALGFILFRTPEQCPHVVSLLSESFNAHVRCGSAMALGISCAGTGNKEALSVIDPMLNDSVPFVQQAAQIASAMILIQHTELMNSKVASFRQHYAKITSDKLEDSLTKFGAIIAQGIIDAGGRNVTISLQSRSGHMHMKTAVGLLVFSQFWYWFPLCHFLSLAFTPTAVIGLNADLKMPKLTFRSNARPSLYAYPQPLEGEKKKEREKVAAAVLSVTAKAKARKTAADGEAMEVDKDKESDKKDTAEDKMEAVSSSTAAAEGAGKSSEAKTKAAISEGEEKEQSSVSGGESSSSGAVKDDKEDSGEGGEKVGGGGGGGEGEGMDTGTEAEKKAAEGGGKDKEGEGKKEKKEPEPDFEMLPNPARVLPQQLKVLSWDENSRYRPLKPITAGGIIMLKDTDTDHPEDLIEPLKVTVPGRDVDEGPEPSPPEPFEWSEDM